MAGKYLLLETYLRALPETDREVRLDFEQIEKIIDSALPASAYEDQRWWRHETEANHVSPRAWANAGWRIGELDVHARRVQFVRAG